LSDHSDNEELINQLRLRFPLPFHPNVRQLSQDYQIPMELIYAIMRQESGFREDVVSSAGAHGLMQVMPSTAHLIAAREKISYNDKKQLLMPKKNITLGAAYLKDLSKRFANNVILMVAAYNAGPRQVHYWLQHKSPEEMDIWIETLPWRETRNYLKNVLSFYAVYQYRMQHKADLSFVMKRL
jgi:soluble lytic murein transglycosylase